MWMWLSDKVMFSLDEQQLLTPPYPTPLLPLPFPFSSTKALIEYSDVTALNRKTKRK